MEINVSLFASSNRPKLYDSFFKSLEGTSVSYEVVFAGDSTNVPVFSYKNLTYIQTANIKPSQCYEIARRACKGETVIWVADDCEFPNDVVGKAYKYWKSKNNPKLILSIQTKESGYKLPKGKLFNMDDHRFFGYKKNSPLMAPLGMMSREFLDKLGGFDRRFICGQYENQCVMMAYAEGGEVEIFGDNNCYIDIDHLGKSIMIGESKNENDFLDRPFAKGYHIDRKVLESSWVIIDWNVSFVRTNKHEPYEEKDILYKSQSNNIKEMWV